MKKNKKLWSWALAGALAISNLSVVVAPITNIVAEAAYGALKNGTNAIENLTKMPGEKTTVTLTAAGAAGATEDIIWASSDPSIVSVEQDKTNPLKATYTVSAGAVSGKTATVTAQVYDNNIGTNDKYVANITVGVKLKSIGFDTTNVSFTGAELAASKTKDIVFSANPTDSVSGTDISLSNSNASVATIVATNAVHGDKITITPVGAGSTTITASNADGSIKATCTVSVDASDPTGLAFSEPSKTMGISATSTYTQEAVFTPETAFTTGWSISYASSNTAVATVTTGNGIGNGDGVVTAKAAGTTTITATASKAGKEDLTASYTVKVEANKPLQTVTFGAGQSNTTEYTTADKGAQIDLNPVINPSDSNESLVWKTVDTPDVAGEPVATLKNGTITLAGGSGTFKVLYGPQNIVTNGTPDVKLAEYLLTVKKVKLQGASLNISSYEIGAGKTATNALKASISPDTAGITKIDWAISDSTKATLTPGKSVASLSYNDVCTIVGGAAGTATITMKVTPANGDAISRECKLTVVTPNVAKSITLDAESLELAKGDTHKLVPTMLPTDPTKDLTTTEDEIVWSTTRPAVATVDKGVVTAKEEGVATITATVEGKTAECVVTVGEKSVDPSALVEAANKAAEAAVANPTAENIKAAQDAVAAAKAAGATPDELKSATDKIAKAEEAKAKADEEAKKAEEEAKKKAEEEQKKQEEAKKAAETAADGSKANTPAPVNTELKDTAGKATGFKVTDATPGKATVEFVAPADKDAKNITVPDTIKDLSGNEYKVTSIASGAFKDSKAKTITIGKNIKKIASDAFKDSKIKTVKVKGTKLTKKMAKAFNKLKKGAKVKVSGSNKKKNKKYLNALKNVKNGNIKVK